MNNTPRLLILLSTIAFAQANLATSLGGGNTRPVLGGGTVNSTFCAVDSGGECHWGPYGLSLANIALPFAILAVLSILALPVFLVGRYALGIFGGRRPAPDTWFFGYNSFCGTVNRREHTPIELNSFSKSVDLTPTPRYSKFQVWGVRVGLAVLLLAVVVCLIVGLVGNGRVGNGIDNSFDDVTNTLNLLSSKITTAVGEIQALPSVNTSAILTVTDSLLGVAKNATTVSQQIRSARDSYEPARSAVTVVILLLPALFIVAAAAGGFFNLPKIIYTAFYLTFLVSFLLWLLTAIYVPVAIMANDACNTAGPFVTNLRSLPSNEVPVTPIAQFVACSNGAQFSTYRSLALQTQSTLRASVCTIQKNICQTSSQTCGSDTCTPGAYNATLAVVVNDISGSTTTRRTMSECATSCTNSNLKTLTAELVIVVGYSAKYDTIYNEDLLPVLNCTIVDPAIDNIISQVCGNASNGSSDVAGVFLALAIIEVFVTVVTLMAYKRWRKFPIAEIRSTTVTDMKGATGFELKPLPQADSEYETSPPRERRL